MLKSILDVVELLDGADITGGRVAAWLRELGADVSVETIEGRGRTDVVRIAIAGTNGLARGGSAPTLGVIGRLGGVGSRPERIGLVSDGDGAVVALAVAAKLAAMARRGDALRGDVLIRTHICPCAPMIPHEPAPFVDAPVDRDRLARAEVDGAMQAIVSIDTTRANRIVKHGRVAITGTVKEGYVLRPTTAMLDIYERVVGCPAMVVPIFTQDITPPGNGIHHINSILQPATVTEAPVVGLALTAPTIIGGAATGVVDEHALAVAARFVVEVAKEFTAGTLAFYYEQELARLISLYGSLRHLQAARP